MFSWDHNPQNWRGPLSEEHKNALIDGVKRHWLNIKVGETRPSDIGCYHVISNDSIMKKISNGILYSSFLKPVCHNFFSNYPSNKL